MRTMTCHEVIHLFHFVILFLFLSYIWQLWPSVALVQVSVMYTNLQSHQVFDLWRACVDGFFFSSAACTAKCSCLGACFRKWSVTACRLWEMVIDGTHSPEKWLETGCKLEGDGEWLHTCFWRWLGTLTISRVMCAVSNHLSNMYFQSFSLLKHLWSLRLSTKGPVKSFTIILNMCCLWPSPESCVQTDRRWSKTLQVLWHMVIDFKHALEDGPGLNTCCRSGWKMAHILQ